MTYDKDEIGSDLRKRIAQERKINIIPFDRDGSISGMDADGTYPSKMSACPCSNRCAPHPTKKDTILCMGCGLETSTARQKKEGLKNKQTRAGTKPFAISQGVNKKKTFYDEDCQIAGGEITSSQDEEWHFPS